MDSQDPTKWHSDMLLAWQLALLRFAVTHDNADRLNVMAIAAEIDRGGRHQVPPVSFSFFRKTSAELCLAILRPDETGNATLRQYLGEIEDPRLKRALAGALEIEAAPPARRRGKRIDLWRGLAPRNHAPSAARLPSTRTGFRT